MIPTCHSFGGAGSKPAACGARESAVPERPNIDDSTLWLTNLPKSHLPFWAVSRKLLTFVSRKPLNLLGGNRRFRYSKNMILPAPGSRALIGSWRIPPLTHLVNSKCGTNCRESVHRSRKEANSTNTRGLLASFHNLLYIDILPASPEYLVLSFAGINHARRVGRLRICLKNWSSFWRSSSEGSGY